MAMDYNKLGGDIADKILEVGKRDNLTAKMVWTAIAQEIVKHIQENAEVNATVNTVSSIKIKQVDIQSLIDGTQSEITINATGTGTAAGLIDQEVTT